MNRILTRTFGFFVSIFGIYIDKTHAVLPPNCTYLSDGIANGARYEEGKCSGATISKGYISFDSDFISNFAACTAGAQVTFYCGNYGSGYCNSTGIYCPKPDFFLDHGCENGGSGACGYFETEIATTGTYYEAFFFLHCSDGHYQKSPSVIMSGDSVGILTGNCLPCSGLRFTNNQLQTYVNNAGSDSGANIQWDAGGGVYITSCRAYLIGTLNDNNGTFEISASGCPYVN